MLAECLEVFRYQLDEKGTALLEDNHIPADGVYVLVDLEQPQKPQWVEIKYDKKNRSFPCEGNQVFTKVRKFDYYSKLIDMNKPVDDKKVIHSNNYVSFFVKMDNILNNGKLNKERIDTYYNILRNPHQKYIKKGKQTDDLYSRLEDEIGVPDVDKIDSCQKWIMENIFQLDKYQIPVTGKSYLKIFFQASIEEYKKESKRYLVPNVYMKNDYNKTVGGCTYGVPNNNMGMNAKKPFLAHKTRSVEVPYLVDSEQALLQNQFFDYLSSFASARKNNIYIDYDQKTIKPYSGMPEENSNGIYIRVEKDKEVKIVQCDGNIFFKRKLPRKFMLYNYVDIKQDSLGDTADFYSRYLTKPHELELLVDDIYFSNFLRSNYFRDASDIKVKRAGLKQAILLSRESLHRWFYEGNIDTVETMLKRVSDIIILGTIQEGYLKKARHQLNLKCSFQRYFQKEGEQVMGDILQSVKEKVRHKINQTETGSFEKDEEYFFAIGQLVYYYISLNKSKKKTHALANPFFNARNDQVIKDRLKRFFLKYNYAIEFHSKRIENLYAMITAYQPEGTVNHDMILAGYLCNNLVYEKKEENINE